MPRSFLLNRDELLDRQAFQLALLDRLKGLSEPREIIAVTAEALGRRLDVARCGFATVDVARAELTVEGVWRADPAAPDPGDAPVRGLGAFGLAIARTLLTGQTLTIGDAQTDARLDVTDVRAAWAAAGARAALVAPLCRDNQLEAILYLVDGCPRDWTAADIALVEDVLLRTGEVIERVHAEAQLRASEARYRSLFTSLQNGFCVVEMIFADDIPVDYRFLEVNDAFTAQSGLDSPIGRTAREMLPDIEPYWFERYGQVALTGEPIRFEEASPALGRWFEVFAYRIDAPEGRRVAILFTDISERRRAELVLAESREELELAQRAARFGRYVFHPLTGEVRWDARCREIFGVAPDAPIDYDGFIALIHPDDRAAQQAIIAAALDPLGTRHLETEYRIVDPATHAERHVVAHGSALVEDGVCTRFIGTVQDVTADRQGQATLRETEERLRLASRATNDAIWDWDLVADQILWTEALTRNFGYDPADLTTVGSWWLDRIHPLDRARVDRSVRGVIDGGGADWTGEYRFRHADGHYIDVLDRGYVLRDEAGAAVRMIGAMMDQSARKSLERALRRDNAGLERTVAATRADRDRLWELSTDIMMRLGTDGRIVATNPAWTRLLGWREDELVDHSIFDLVDPQDAPALARRAEALGHGLLLDRFDNRLRARDGALHWINWAMQADDGVINAVGRDVTADKRREERLSEMEAALRQAQKMEAVGQLTGGIAHDFNNMLTGILGGLDMIARNLPAERSEKVDRYIDAAATSAERAAALTQRLLAFSRRQSLEIRSTDVAHLVAGVEELLRRTIGEAIDLAVEAQDGLWQVTTDASQLESSLVNLVINARDAMPGGGRLTISLANATLDAAYCAAHDGLAAGDYVALAVIDTGAGMSDAVLEKVFEPFFTTKPLGRGTGLGLSMIYGFVRQSHGHVTVASTQGEGTTVTLYLPRDAGTTPARPPARVSRPLDRAAANECVLVVEDDASVRMLIVEVLEGLGYGVLQAADGRAAARIVEGDAAIDLLVTDVGLPELNGRQLAEIAVGRRPGLPVLFVTGYAEKAAMRNEFLGEGMEMITKPFAIDDLSRRIRQIMTTRG